MAMVGVVSDSLYRRTHSLSRLAWSWVGGRLAPFYIHRMTGELSQWLCHDDSTINIVLDIIIILLYYISTMKDDCMLQWKTNRKLRTAFLLEQI